jgi:hypothetical protein
MTPAQHEERDPLLRWVWMKPDGPPPYPSLHDQFRASLRRIGDLAFGFAGRVFITVTYQIMRWARR